MFLRNNKDEETCGTHRISNYICKTMKTISFSSKYNIWFRISLWLLEMRFKIKVTISIVYYTTNIYRWYALLESVELQITCLYLK